MSEVPLQADGARSVGAPLLLDRCRANMAHIRHEARPARGCEAHQKAQNKTLYLGSKPLADEARNLIRLARRARL